MKISVLISFFLIILTSSASAQEVKTGSFEITGTISTILDEEYAKLYQDVIDADKHLVWEVNVPENYTAEDPPGVLVYISPSNSVNVPRGWLEVTDDRNLIWVAALNSGNKIPANERIVMALLALEAIQSKYKIDPDRIFVSGLSGGGRVASLAATYYPGIFKGAIYNCGANFWSNAENERLEQIKQNRFVFITGTKDFNLNDTKSVYGKYKHAGVENINLMVIPRMGHENPGRNKFEQALLYLDDIQ